MKMEVEFKQGPDGNVEFFCRIKREHPQTMLENEYIRYSAAALRQIVPQIAKVLGAKTTVDLTDAGNPKQQ